MKAALKFLEEAGMNISAACLSAIMLIVTTDAISRYTLSTPLSWSFSVITLYLIPAATFFALASTFRSRGNITIDFITQFLSPETRRYLTLMANIAFLPLLALIVYISASDAMEAYRQTRFSPGVIAWREWPHSAIIAVGSALLVISIASEIIADLRDISRGKPAEAILAEEELL